jgi:hypothetical protein
MYNLIDLIHKLADKYENVYGVYEDPSSIIPVPMNTDWEDGWDEGSGD